MTVRARSISVWVALLEWLGAVFLKGLRDIAVLPPPPRPPVEEPWNSSGVSHKN